MKRPLAFLAALLSVASSHAAEGKSAPAITFEELAPPSPPGSVGVSLVRASSGTVWLSWIEMVGDKESLRFSTFAPVLKNWSVPSNIKQDARFLSYEWPTPIPAITAGDTGYATAAWFIGGASHNPERSAFVSQTTDAGRTWGSEHPLTAEATTSIESVALATLADGRILAAWLDGRDFHKREKEVLQLFARVLGESGPDVLVDPSVARVRSHLSLTAFPDGGALLAYHGHTDGNLTTVRTARFRGQTWDASKPLDSDVGRATGPRLASDGGRVAVAWFTAANNNPRVLASFSPDAGARFLQPLRIDRGKPAGSVDTLILHDGALLVVWPEGDGSVWLRRVTPDFTTDAPVQLAPPGATIAKAVPRVARVRIALVRDYVGGKTSAQFVAAFSAGDAAPLRTLLVTVPEGELLNAEKNCDCAPTPEQLLGFAMRGTIAAVATSQGTVRVRHDEVPGVLAAGLHEFSVSPDIAATVATGRQFLGRIERRDGAWRLFDVRLFVAK